MPFSYNLSIFFEMRNTILATCLAANRLNAIDCAEVVRRRTKAVN
jgi:hypothetical protein